MSTFVQRSFAGGEIAPALYARVDQTKHATGVRTCRNFFVQRHGGLSNRPGMGFVAEVKDSTKAVKLMPFVFNAAQTYVLEFGDLYMRVHQAGAQLVEASKVITGITQANPAVVSVAAHGYSTGDEVFITGIVGMTEVNGRNFKIGATTAGTFEIEDLGGTGIDSTGFAAYVSGGTAAKVFEIVTPYLEAQVPDLQFVQSADVITIVHPSHSPRELSRITDTNWTLLAIVFDPGIGRPNGGTGARGAVGTLTFQYRVTAIDEDTREESLPGREATKAITGATQANPVVITAAAHGYSTGDEVFITGVVGMTEINDRRFTITNLTASTFELDDEDGTGHGAYTSGGTSARTFIRIDLAAAPTTAGPNLLTWTAVTKAIEYNIYKVVNGVYGFIGIAGTATFSDDGVVAADTTETPPIERQVFDESGDFPSTVTYFQQRQMFARTDNEPEKVFGSRTASFKNFATSSPLQDDDALFFTLVGREVNQVRHMLPLGTLVILTSGGEWIVQGDEAGILKPVAINAKQQGYFGASTLRPLIVGNTALFVQERGNIVRDLGFDIAVDGYRGNDLTIFAPHLVDNFTIKDWSYARIPHSIVWAVRSDGTLLGLTYVRDHEVFGWHRHDTDGTFENVVAVPEGTEDAVYLIVKRTVDGRSVRYLERMKTRRIGNIEDSVFMDAALTFDGNDANTGQTMTLSGGPPWTATSTLTLTASSATFAASDVGDEIHLTGSGGTIIRFAITGFTSSTVVTGKPNKDVPVAMQNVAISDWCRAVKTVGNLHHLEGKRVSVLGDGFVVVNPNNEPDAAKILTVTNGLITLPKAKCVIHVGLPYTSDLLTLDLDTASAESIVDKEKLISKVAIFVDESRGIFAGRDAPTSLTSVDDLQELKIRNTENYDEPVALATGVVDLLIEPAWNKEGRVFIRQTDPLPLSVLAVAPIGLAPFVRGG